MPYVLIQDATRVMDAVVAWHHPPPHVRARHITTEQRHPHAHTHHDTDATQPLLVVHAHVAQQRRGGWKRPEAASVAHWARPGGQALELGGEHGRRLSHARCPVIDEAARVVVEVAQVVLRVLCLVVGKGGEGCTPSGDDHL